MPRSHGDHCPRTRDTVPEACEADIMGVIRSARKVGGHLTSLHPFLLLTVIIRNCVLGSYAIEYVSRVSKKIMVRYGGVVTT